jgi:Domain of unknown function (DUF4270)
VQKRILSVACIALLFSIMFVGCSKLDTTDIGSDLLPAVDNVNTFDTIIPIITTQGIFNPDTTAISSAEDHVLGKINNDPLFGTTEANIYAEFKPAFYPYYYGNAKDTILSFDSVVLCLSYKGFWGDSTLPLKLDVQEVAPAANGLWDSLGQSRFISYTPLTTGVTIGSKTVDIAGLGNYVKFANGKDSVKNQIRIKLSQAFANTLFSLDTNATNPFRSDSLFRLFKKGFAIRAGNSSGSNGILYTNLTDFSSRLEIHFRRKNGGPVDTTFSSFKIFTTATSTETIKPSATVNNIIRSRAGYPVSSPSPNEVYLQTTPGTYVNLSIPSLPAVSNRIIHRAEIIIEQIPDAVASVFSVPNFLYLELKDTSLVNNWKPVYFDLNPGVAYDPDFKFTSFFPNGGIDYLYHGGYVRDKKDQFGTLIKYYNFNITRYVQQIITKHTPNYQLRLYAPYIINYPQYNIGIFENGRRNGNNLLANGRIKVGGGNNPNYTMRLRLVYSKI